MEASLQSVSCTTISSTKKNIYSLMAIPVTQLFIQPAVNIKITLQQSKHSISIIEACGQILMQRSLKHTLQDYTLIQFPRLLRVTITPWGAKQLAQTILEHYPHLSPSFAYGLAGGIVAASTSIISLPSNNLLSYSINNQISVLNAMTIYHKHLGIHRIFEQAPKMIFMHSASWLTFLTTQTYVANKYHHIKNKSTLNLKEISGIAFISLFMSNLVITPTEHAYYNNASQPVSKQLKGVQALCSKKLLITGLKTTFFPNMLITFPTTVAITYYLENDKKKPD